MIEAFGHEELAGEARCNNSESMEIGSIRVFLRSHDGVMSISILLGSITEYGLSFFYILEEGRLPLTDQEQNPLKQTAAEIQRILNEESDYKFEALCPV